MAKAFNSLSSRNKFAKRHYEAIALAMLRRLRRSTVLVAPGYSQRRLAGPTLIDHNSPRQSQPSAKVTRWWSVSSTALLDRRAISSTPSTPSAKLAQPSARWQTSGQTPQQHTVD
jgi:hypothetical protein